VSDLGCVGAETDGCWRSNEQLVHTPRILSCGARAWNQGPSSELRLYRYIYITEFYPGWQCYSTSASTSVLVLVLISSSSSASAGVDTGNVVTVVGSSAKAGAGTSASTLVLWY
jgi:hypothetical protein